MSTKPEYAYRGYSRLSVIYRTSERFKEAMESAQKVLEKFPDDIDANYTYSLSAEKLGEIDKAVDGYLKLIKINQKRASEYYSYAVNALMKAEKYQRIIEISKEFTKNFP
ncbi:MAG: tetratricopeptide repeat protein, partial [Bacillus sp. (in: Bacteria)]|nr:tetratricopeptide repeat protein [Bacillus sp. (in: firmicutes)]